MVGRNECYPPNPGSTLTSVMMSSYHFYCYNGLKPYCWMIMSPKYYLTFLCIKNRELCDFLHAKQQQQQQKNNNKVTHPK